MTEQWQELKETITEMRDNDGTGTQQEVCKFLVDLMNILEKQIQEPTDDYFRKMAGVVISQLRADRDRLEDELAKVRNDMADIELVIKIPKDVYTRLFDNGIQDNEIATDDICEMARSLRRGTPLNEPFINKSCISEGVCHEDKVKVLDKIRTEIDEQIKYNTYFNSDMAKGEIIAFEWVKRKIDEYTKGESL